MKKNLKNSILKTAVHDFKEYGYENTTMRQIASQLKLAVGNVNYYYAKKEDIVKDYHNGVMDAFLTEVLSRCQDQNPWITYFMAEYSFMSYIAHDIPTRNLYKSFINVPALRDFYVERHQQLFLSVFNDVLPSDENEIFLSTLAMCSLEFDLIGKFDLYQDVWDFDDVITHIFETRLSFLHFRISEYRDLLSKAVELGKNSEFMSEALLQIPEY